jgi:hypothetical protein
MDTTSSTGLAFTLNRTTPSQLTEVALLGTGLMPSANLALPIGYLILMDSALQSVTSAELPTPTGSAIHATGAMTL